MRTYGPGNGTYGKEKRRGLPSHAGGIRQEGTKASHTKKMNGEYFLPFRFFVLTL